MSRGPSGRIVAEIQPELKRFLYAELARNGVTLKDWLISQARSYIAESQQPTLFAPSKQTSDQTRSGK